MSIYSPRSPSITIHRCLSYTLHSPPSFNYCLSSSPTYPPLLPTPTPLITSLHPFLSRQHRHTQMAPTVAKHGNYPEVSRPNLASVSTNYSHMWNYLAANWLPAFARSALGPTGAVPYHSRFVRSEFYWGRIFQPHRIGNSKLYNHKR